MKDSTGNTPKKQGETTGFEVPNFLPEDEEYKHYKGEYQCETVQRIWFVEDMPIISTREQIAPRIAPRELAEKYLKQIQTAMKIYDAYTTAEINRINAMWDEQFDAEFYCEAPKAVDNG